MILLLAGVAVAGLLAGAKWNVPIRSLWHKLQPATAPQSQSVESAQAHYYSCGMHPWVILPHPGECPICHMDLVPLDPAKFTGEIAIDPVIAQNIGVRIAPVTAGEVTRTVRTVGTVDYNETLVRDVNLKISGWVEKLYADYVGKPVRKGEPLLEIYSPELYSAQEEYLQAYRRSRGQGAAAPAAKDVPDVAKWNTDLLEAARKRLEYYDISADQVAELEKSGKVRKTLTLRSPYDGLMIDKAAFEGMKVESGMRLFRLADLSSVWMMVTLYEYQLPFVQIGQTAAISLPYIPGQTFSGKVKYIYPYLDPKTRQVSVRLEFENPGLSLKPGMFANVELRSTLARQRVLVPREAVLDTGERQVAFVSLGEGKFEPRTVKTGVEAQDGKIEVLEGLKPGEMVVVSGEFLLDSEARLREALAKMIRGDLAVGQKLQAAVAGQSELDSLPEAASRALVDMLDNYFVIGSHLADDRMPGIAEAARKVAAGVDALLAVEIPGNPHFWHRHTEAADVRGKALEMVAAKNVEVARQLFADLSTAFDKLLKATGVPSAYGKEVQEVHCPMYREGQGGTWWLQRAGEINNPYMPLMRQCHDKLFTLPVTGAKSSASQPATAPAAATQPAAAKPTTLPLAARQQVDRLVTAYLEIQKLLAADKSAGVEAQLAAVAGEAQALAAEAPLGTLAQRIAAAAGKKAANIEDFRVNDKELSLAVIELVKVAPPSSKVVPILYQMNCPMAKADWLQATSEVANPYYGSGMLTCGSVVAQFPAAPAEK